MTLRYTYKSLEGQFPRELTPDHKRKPSPFGKSWTETLELLHREMKMLGYREDSCVIQTAHTPYDVRNDGMLRRGARAPSHPGLVVRFDVWDRPNRRYMPMSFECDQFTSFEANLRAIADALEALRKVDRYGVSGGGKANAHYEGYKALPPASDGGFTVETAALFIAQHTQYKAADIKAYTEIRDRAFRHASMKLHPDAGGSHEDFVKLTAAKRVLEENAT